MPKVRVSSFAISADGFGAGPEQSLDHPLGKGGQSLHGWFYPTRTFQAMIGRDGGETGVDDDFAARGMANVGAWILGRNMFAPSRGPWVQDGWQGWWGDTPPYHVPVYVLTHHARPPLEMKGGTTFHFITGGAEEALALARAAAGEKDVRVGGGARTIRQYLQKGLLDELHLVVSPVLLGSGEPLLSGIDLPKLGYRCSQHTSTERALHLVITKS